jgi:hypothetical protein
MVSLTLSLFLGMGSVLSMCDDCADHGAGVHKAPADYCDEDRTDACPCADDLSCACNSQIPSSLSDGTVAMVYVERFMGELTAPLQIDLSSALEEIDQPPLRT